MQLERGLNLIINFPESLNNPDLGQHLTPGAAVYNRSVLNLKPLIYFRTVYSAAKNQ